MSAAGAEYVANRPARHFAERLRVRLAFVVAGAACVFASGCAEDRPDWQRTSNNQAPSAAGGEPPRVEDMSGRILSVDYGRFRPKGAERAYPAFRIRAADPNGQIVAMEVDVRGGFSGHADGDCDLAGKESGEVETWHLPTQRLEPGTHQVRVSAESHPCDGTNSPLEKFSRTVAIRVGQNSQR